MVSQYIYRFFKSTWGVYVDLTAEWVCQADFKGKTIAVVPNIQLSIDDLNLSLVADELEFLALAIKLASQQMTERLGDQLPIVIHCLVLNIAETDYQPEGLTHALMGWMTQEFGVQVSLPPPVFDKANNRYVFEFPDVLPDD